MPSLHTSECNTTPRQAQAVTIPMGMQLSEEYFFYLIVHLPERCSWETALSQPEKDASPQMCWKIAFEKIRGKVDLTSHWQPLARLTCPGVEVAVPSESVWDPNKCLVTLVHFTPLESSGRRRRLALSELVWDVSAASRRCQR